MIHQIMVLNPEESNDPSKVFEEIFDSIPLNILQEQMWSGVKAMVSGRYKYLSSQEKEMQLEIFEKLQKAIVAMSIIVNKKNETK